jgi:hypothetical protein
MVKYLVIPGNVRSRNDGDIHYISARQLMQLYGVNPDECVIYDNRFGGRQYSDELIPLRPMFNGNYTLPSK